MIIMGDRLLGLQHIIEGFAKTGIPLVGWNGSSITPFLVLDDIGIYVFIPQLMRFLGISLQQSIDLFFFSIMGCSFFLAFLGFFLLYKTTLTKFISISCLSFLFYFVIKFSINDVYLAYLAGGLSILPILLYFLLKNSQSKIVPYFIVASGIILGSLHYIRAHSGLGALLFILIMILSSYEYSIKKKIILISCLFCGIAAPILYFKSVINTYEHYAQKEIKAYKEFPTVHPFWHTIYLGFGFLKYLNSDEISWRDGFAYDRARKIDPSISHTSNFSSYEKIIKNETHLLWKNQLFFCIYTIFAKIGVLFLFLLLFAHVGLFVRFFCTQAWNLELAFIAALSCYAVFPVIALPQFSYSIGFITMATLYGICSINNFLQNYSFKISMAPLLRIITRSI